MSKPEINVEDSIFGDESGLYEPSFNNDVLAPDPAVPTRMPVTIDQIIPWAGNPRTQENPNYDEIKESIRHSGLHHPPNITRKTPADKYMIRDGGNTRLRILQELWQETNDPRYYTIDCMFHPYSSDKDVLVRHIVENEMRGKMSFIDRARAVVRLRAFIEAEKGEELSARKLASEITALGWTMAIDRISPLLFAHETLLPWLPKTLDAGMGRPAVSALRKFLDNLEKYWDSVANDEDGPLAPIWQTVLLELDEIEAFSIEAARTEIEDAVSIKLGVPLPSVRLEIQALENGLIDKAERGKPLELSSREQSEQRQPVPTTTPDQPHSAYRDVESSPTPECGTAARNISEPARVTPETETDPVPTHSEAAAFNVHHQQSEFNQPTLANIPQQQTIYELHDQVIDKLRALLATARISGDVIVKGESLDEPLMFYIENIDLDTSDLMAISRQASVINLAQEEIALLRYVTDDKSWMCTEQGRDRYIELLQTLQELRGSLPISIIVNFGKLATQGVQPHQHHPTELTLEQSAELYRVLTSLQQTIIQFTAAYIEYTADRYAIN